MESVNVQENFFSENEGIENSKVSLSCDTFSSSGESNDICSGEKTRGSEKMRIQQSKCMTF